MIRLLLGICAVVVVALAGCTAIAVQHDYDPDVDFSTYRSFAWMPLTAHQSGVPDHLSGPFLHKRIRKALAEELTESGLDYAPESADVLVAYQLNYKNKSEINAAYPHAIDVRRYREGTLIIDLVDPDTKALIWRGWGVSDLHRSTDPQQEQEQIERAVRKILARYPPYKQGA